MTRDDDDLELTPEERARAQAFGELVDDMLRGRSAPPALPAEERALLEMATVVRAAEGKGFLLPDSRRDAMIDSALRPEPAQTAGGAVSALHDRRSKLARRLPWALTAIAAAAAVILALRPPPAPEPQVARVPARALSRPADPLIGRIAPADADRASARLDAIYADRMTGYRSVRLGGAQ